MGTLRKIVKLFKSIATKDQKALVAGVGVVQYTITLCRTTQGLPGALNSLDASGHSCACELIGVQLKRGGTRLPHQINTAIRGLRRGLSGERRAQAFFRALIQLKGCRIIELPPMVIDAPHVTPTVEPKPQPAAAQPAPEAEVIMPADDDVPDSWDDE